MPANRRPSRPCAQCGAALVHVPRQPGERSAQRQAGQAPTEAHPKSHRHYRCPVAACGWDGWLPRRSREVVGGILRRRRASNVKANASANFSTRQRWLVPALTALSVTAGATALGVVALRVLMPPPPVVTRPTSLAPGEYDDGRALPAAHPLRRYVLWQLAAERRTDGATPGEPFEAAAANLPAATASASPVPAPVPAPGPAPVPASLHNMQDSLTYRHGCVWGQPGRNPYRGTVEQALRASALPAEVVRKIASQVRAGSATDRVAISSAGIRAAGSGRVFDASHFAMTYGMTLCTSTRVNFVAGHVEQASLYEASDNQGRIYAVMVPDVCGNVSVLGEAEDRRRTTAVAGSSDDAAADPRTEVADAPEAGRTGAGPGVAGFVPDNAAPGAGAGREGARGFVATPLSVPGAPALGGTVVADNTRRTLPDVLAWKEPASSTQGSSDGPREVHSVPEPGTLASALLALAVMLGLGWRRRRRP